MTSTNHITVSEETQIDLPTSRKVMGIVDSEWMRLKKMVSRISESKDYWQNAGWFASASAISFFVASLTTTGFSIFNPNLLSMLTVVGIVAAIIFFIADNTMTKNRKVNKQDIIELMQEMEGGSTPKLENNTPPIENPTIEPIETSTGQL